MRKRNNVEHVPYNKAIGLDGQLGGVGGRYRGVGLGVLCKLFTASVPQVRKEAFRFTTTKVTHEMNEMLIREPTEEEIKKAMFAIHPEKASGPDEMTSLFYQRF